MHASIAHTDRQPGPPTFIPPLHIALAQARRVLNEANALDLSTADSFALAREFGGVCEVLRQVLAALDAGDARPETLSVRVCDRGEGREYVGVAIRTVTIPAVCPQCGGPRGVDTDGNSTIRNHNFHEDGEWLSVDKWNNPCGHVDMYDAVLREARAYAEAGESHA